ncbi:SUMF1/EgtB/PvdO family nonheme iron enzyme, partial [Oceanihabitans sp. 2_MG-2023]|uniref:SUMF1/EgtB/PvdO family nonheme iron enzyme n=1 Tax=Oceanihabitans sp. 2_MG-2023 TaxID=3062661 RepID=UPI0026E1D4C4
CQLLIFLRKILVAKNATFHTQDRWQQLNQNFMKKLNIILILGFLIISCSSDNEQTNNPTETTISTTDFSITIDENPLLNQILGTINATTNSGNLTFSIENQSPNGAIAINSTTGELKVANENLFDFEITPIISGVIKVSNNSIFEVLNFSINLNDVNETDPNINCGIVLKDIIGGTFIMGGITTQNDSPEVSVTLSNYKISEKEITNQEYVNFLNSALADGLIYVSIYQFSYNCGILQEYGIYGSENSTYQDKLLLHLNNFHGGCTNEGTLEYWNVNNKSWIDYDNSNNTFSLLDNSKSNWPVNWVTWDGAFAFAQYCDMSLPTEAQWEYAARGGNQLEYPTGNGTISSNQANYNGEIPYLYNPNVHINAVGQFTPNLYGLYDMGGNVFEFCQDYYNDSFYLNGITNPVNNVPGANSRRVIRGGSFRSHSETLLTYYRSTLVLYDLNQDRGNHIGFRVVKN